MGCSNNDSKCHLLPIITSIVNSSSCVVVAQISVDALYWKTAPQVWQLPTIPEPIQSISTSFSLLPINYTFVCDTIVMNLNRSLPQIIIFFRFKIFLLKVEYATVSLFLPSSLNKICKKHRKKGLEMGKRYHEQYVFVVFHSTQYLGNFE